MSRGLFNKIIVIGLCLFLNSACKPPGPVCLYAPSPTTSANSERLETTTTVKANGNYSAVITTKDQLSTYSSQQDIQILKDSSGKWVQSGFIVNKGDAIDLKTQGKVFMCESVGTSLTDNDGKGVKIGILATNSNWQSVFYNSFYDNQSKYVYVRKGDELIIRIDEPNPACTRNDSRYDPSCGRWITKDWGDDGNKWTNPPLGGDPTLNNKICKPDQRYAPNCWHIRGHMLYGKIGNSDTFDVKADKVTDQPFSEFKVNTDNISAGNLVLQIEDTNNSDNYGGYNVYVSNFACKAENGNPSEADPRMGYLEAIVTPNDPNQTMQGASYLQNVNGSNIAPIGGDIWFRVKDYDDQYFDNVGSYSVSISTGVYYGVFSSIINKLVKSVKDNLFTTVERSYKSLTCTDGGDQANCSDYIKSLRLMIMLYIIFYAIFFMFGLVRINQYDLVIRIIKIGVILQLTTPGSWEFFKSTLFNAFMEGGAQLINRMTGNLGSNDNPFAFIDVTLELLIFSPDTILRLLALLLTSLLGPVYLVMILYGTFIYLKAILKAVVTYILAFIAISILLSLAPIFIPFIMFSMTKHLFDNWIKYLVRYTLEPVVLIVGLAIFSQILLITLYKIMGYAVCWKCAIPINVPFINVPLFCIDFFTPWGYDNLGNGVSVVETVISKFVDILMFIIIVKMIEKYEDFAKQMTSFLTQSGTTPSVSGGGGGYFRDGKWIGGSPTNEFFDGISNGAKSVVGLDEKSVGRRNAHNSLVEQAKERAAREVKKEMDRDRSSFHSEEDNRP